MNESGGPDSESLLFIRGESVPGLSVSITKASQQKVFAK